MPFYVVDAKLNEDEALTADVPSGVEWVGQYVGGRFLIRTERAIPGGKPIPANMLRVEAEARGLKVSDLMERWRSGGN